MAKDLNITPIKNPIAIKNAITNKILPNVRQTHVTQVKKIYTKQVSFSNTLLFKVDNTLMIIEREFQKAIMKSGSEIKNFLDVRI